MKLDKNKRIIIVGVIVLIISAIAISATYAFFKIATDKGNTLTEVGAYAECFDINYGSENNINLDYQYPITDEFALENVEPVTITVTNNCTNNVKAIPYTLAITSLINDNSIPDSAIRMYVKKQVGTSAEGIVVDKGYLSDVSKISTGLIYDYLMADLNKRDDISTYISRNMYLIDNAALENNTTATYKLYLWVDYYEGDAGAYSGEEHDTSYDGSTEGKGFASAVSLIVNDMDSYEVFNVPDIIIDVKTSGVAGVVPTSGLYTKNISCNQGSATYDPKYNRVVFSSVSSPARCTLEYTKDNSNYDTLIEVIQAEKTRTDVNDGICSKSEYTTKSACESNSGIWWGVYDEKITMDNSTFAPTTTLEQTSYTISTMETTSDNKNAFIWDDIAKTWTSQNHTKNTTSNGGVGMEFTLPNGYYQLCYTMGSEKNYDYGTVYIDGTEKFNTKGKDTNEHCEYLGNITSSNVIRVAYRKDGSGDTSPDNIVFYIQGGTYVEKIEEVSTGLRYEGLQPNNHIWFNNEIWRIIGYVPTKDADGNDTQLVKIIRAESIGGLTINSSGSTYVGSRMYNLLNTYYYGAQDGTKSGYCYAYSSSGTTCNYESIGLNTISQNMIEPVQWAIGMQGSASDVGTHYATEVGTYTNTSGGIKIGLMNISDYGYSVIDDDCARDTSLGSYNTASCTGKAWLYGQGHEWTMSPDSSSSLWLVDGYGNAYNYSAYIGFSTRPVLYLDTRVYKISGSGTMADPYIIGM